MTRLAFLLVGGALVVGGLAGCSSTAPTPTVSYNASENRTSYRTGTMRIGRLDGAGYGSNTAILLSVKARCSGPECTPEAAQLTFLLQGSASDVALSNRSVSIVADGQTFTRRNTSRWHSREDIRMSQGRVAGLRLSLSELETIAAASSLSGQLGDNPLDFDQNVRSHLREFVRTARGAETSEEDGAS
jgi:hypothetical protein